MPAESCQTLFLEALVIITKDFCVFSHSSFCICSKRYSLMSSNLFFSLSLSVIRIPHLVAPPPNTIGIPWMLWSSLWLRKRGRHSSTMRVSDLQHLESFYRINNPCLLINNEFCRRFHLHFGVLFLAMLTRSGIHQTTDPDGPLIND